jgi:hypothetical protein
MRRKRHTMVRHSVDPFVQRRIQLQNDAVLPVIAVAFAQAQQYFGFVDGVL